FLVQGGISTSRTIATVMPTISAIDMIGGRYDFLMAQQEQKGPRLQVCGAKRTKMAIHRLGPKQDKRVLGVSTNVCFAPAESDSGSVIVCAVCGAVMKSTSDPESDHVVIYSLCLLANSLAARHAILYLGLLV